MLKTIPDASIGVDALVASLFWFLSNPESSDGLWHALDACKKFQPCEVCPKSHLILKSLMEEEQDEQWKFERMKKREWVNFSSFHIVGVFIVSGVRMTN